MRKDRRLRQWSPQRWRRAPPHRSRLGAAGQPPACAGVLLRARRRPGRRCARQSRHRPHGLDFTIVEDGVTQPIAQFSTRAFSAQTPARPRTFAVLLGRGNHEPGKGIDAVIDFVRSDLLPTDRVIVMAYLRATEPTTDRAAVLRLLESYRTVYLGIEGNRAADSRGRQFALSPVTLSAIDRLFRQSGLPAVQILSGGAGGSVSHYNDINYLSRAIEYLRGIDGQKHLVALLETIGLGAGGDSLSREELRPRA